MMTPARTGLRAKLRFAIALATMASAGACTGKPPVDSFCEKFRPFDFTDRGYLGLNRANKEATQVNDNTRERDCAAKK